MGRTPTPASSQSSAFSLPEVTAAEGQIFLGQISPACWPTSGRWPGSGHSPVLGQVMGWIKVVNLGGTDWSSSDLSNRNSSTDDTGTIQTQVFALLISVLLKTEAKATEHDWPAGLSPHQPFMYNYVSTYACV